MDLYNYVNFESQYLEWDYLSTQNLNHVTDLVFILSKRVEKTLDW